MLDALFAASPDAMLVIDAAEIVLANPAAAALLHAADANALQRTPWRRYFAGHGADSVADLLARLAMTPGDDVAALAPLNATETWLRRLDGTDADVEITARALVHGGRTVVQVVIRDLAGRRLTESALRESEERLRLAFAGAQEGVWDWDLATGAVVYSARWKEMLGYGEDEIEPHLSAWERLVHPDDRARAETLNDELARGGETYEGEFRLRHKDGSYINVLSRGLPVRRDPGGPVVRIVGTHFDLTERKRAEEMLRRAHEELELRVAERTQELAEANASLRAEMSERQRAERARTELLGRLVFAQEDERRRIAREMHDQFGEQLTALSRTVRALKDHCANRPALLAVVETLETVTARLDRDVDYLVWELRPTALDDLGLRAALANYVHDWASRVGVRAELHSTGLLDTRLPSELETTLYRIAQEALTNVAKHADAKTVEVILERRPDHVLLVVEDDGRGFERADNAANGFGLVGMQERAALVGATLEIESTPGQGTTVLVRMTI